MKTALPSRHPGECGGALNRDGFRMVPRFCRTSDRACGEAAHRVAVVLHLGRQFHEVCDGRAHTSIASCHLIDEHTGMRLQRLSNRLCSPEFLVHAVLLPRSKDQHLQSSSTRKLGTNAHQAPRPAIRSTVAPSSTPLMRYNSTVVKSGMRVLSGLALSCSCPGGDRASAYRLSDSSTRPAAPPSADTEGDGHDQHRQATVGLSRSRPRRWSGGSA